MSFIEAEFPKTISTRALGGPAFNTTVNEGKSGFEQRNQNWQVARGEWTVSLTTPGASTVDPQVYIDQLTAFFLNVGGKVNGFRLKDHKEFTNGSAAQVVGTGDAATTYFQLIKTYSSAGLSYVRNITKPVTSIVVDYLGSALLDSVDIYLNATVQSRNAGYAGGGTARYSLDETTGLINFGSSTTIVTVTALTNVAGQQGFTCTWTGPAPQRNQQVIFSGLSSALNGAWIVASVGTNSLVIKRAVLSTGADSGHGYTGWGTFIITGASKSGTAVTYSYSSSVGAAPVAGMRVTLSGMGTSSNNGTFYITGIGTGTFTVYNASGDTETHAGFAVTDWVPTTGVAITAKYQFHFPVRFDTDQLALQLEESDVADGHPIVTWNAITLKELRISAGSSQG